MGRECSSVGTVLAKHGQDPGSSPLHRIIQLHASSPSTQEEEKDHKFKVVSQLHSELKACLGYVDTVSKKVTQ